MRAPYNAEEIARNLRHNIQAVGFKNKWMGCAQFANLAGISENTALNWDKPEYQQIEAHLGKPYSIIIKKHPHRKPREIKVSGCHYGPLGLIAWPVGHRILGRACDFRDRVIEFRQESCDIRVGECKSRKRRLSNFFPLLHDLW